MILTLKNSFVLFGLLGLAFGPFAEASWKVKSIRTPEGDTIQSVEQTETELDRGQVTLRSLPALLDEGPLTSQEIYEEKVFSDSAMPLELLKHAEKQNKDIEAWAGSEVRTLVNQGPVANSIDLVITGDGYTAAEKARFFEDAERLTQDLFQGQTFASYLPLFNVHAVFVPSNQSGITDGSNRKDTAFKLYRDPPGSKRAILPGNAAAIRNAIRLAPDSDFPIVVANDDYYGGLGGEFAITTRSKDSGPMVLRHELGHNLSNVGEEYDSGGAYFGANFSATPQVPWKHWVAGEIKTPDTRYLSGKYVWQSLTRNPLQVDFDFPAESSNGPFTFYGLLSTVGWKTQNDVRVTLDGSEVELTGIYTEDRSFFQIGISRTLAPGRHTLKISDNGLDQDNVLAFASLFALPANYDTNPENYGAYPVFYSPGVKSGYRPTHETCLMRDMRSVRFCSVDQENMWVRFLSRVSLVDRVSIEPQADGARKVVLQAPELPGLSIRWFEISSSGGAQELTQYRNQRSWTADAERSGRYQVQVQFRTPEVRAYTRDFDVEKSFQL